MTGNRSAGMREPSRGEVGADRRPKNRPATQGNVSGPSSLLYEHMIPGSFIARKSAPSYFERSVTYFNEERIRAWEEIIDERCFIFEAGLSTLTRIIRQLSKKCTKCRDGFGPQVVIKESRAS